MKIGIDCRTILNPESGELAGVGMYTYQLVLNLLQQDLTDTEIYLFFERGAERAVANVKGQMPNVKIHYFPKWKVRVPFFYPHLYIGKWLEKFNLDLLHAPAHTYPLGYKGRVVVTVHDLAIYKYPQFFPPQPYAVKFLVPRSLNQASHIISVSQSTKNDIMEIFGIDENKISVIYLGFDPSLYSPADNSVILSPQDEKSQRSFAGARDDRGITKPYILTVGTLQPRKNHIGLIRAYAKTRENFLSRGLTSGQNSGQKLQLVIVGNKGWMYEPILKEAEKLGSDVVFTDYVRAEELPVFYKNASVFAFPSFYEGFGLPLLEAMASGVPCVSGNISSLPEVGGEVPLYVDPNDVDEITRALEKVLTDKQERQRQLRLSPGQVQKFSWSKMAEQTYRVYKGALNT